MNTKTCSKCKNEKPLEEFSKRGKSGRQAYCRLCNTLSKRDWYKSNKDRVRLLSKKRRNENYDFMYSYLSQHPCVDCGENDLVVLEFDHLEDKVENISTLVSNCYSLEKLKKEIAKCEVVCANCHKRRTAKRGNFKRLTWGVLLEA